jgi:hypothetical protein
MAFTMSMMMNAVFFGSSLMASGIVILRSGLGYFGLFEVGVWAGQELAPTVQSAEIQPLTIMEDSGALRGVYFRGSERGLRRLGSRLFLVYLFATYDIFGHWSFSVIVAADNHGGLFISCLETRGL